MTAPAPWSIWQDKDADGETFDIPGKDGHRVIFDANDRAILLVCPGGAEGAKLARQVVALPDLLAALERIDNFPENPAALGLFVANVRTIARAALAKVKGGA